MKDWMKERMEFSEKFKQGKPSMNINDFINFLRIFNAMRNGSLEERKAVQTNKADVEFIVAVVEAGLFDKWSALADDIVKGV